MDKKLLDQLAARAEQKAKDRLEVKRFSVGGVEMQFRKPKQAAQLEYYGRLSEAGGADDIVPLCAQLIYDCCDDLQDPELHKALGVVDPYDTVPRLMDVAEIDQLGGALMRWMGLIGTPVKTADGAQSTQAEETAKNS